MNLISKEITKDFEILEITVSQDHSIIIEIFKVPNGFEGFARSSHPDKGDIVGTAFHLDKKECAMLSYKNLKGLLTN